MWSSIQAEMGDVKNTEAYCFRYRSSLLLFVSLLYTLSPFCLLFSASLSMNQ